MHEVFDQFKQQLPDIDPAETQEWMESLDAVVEQEGADRARYLIYKLLKRARQLNVGLPPLVQTRYINTISPEQEPYFPGDEAMELRIRRMIRWNALAMVLRANTRFEGIGGHLSTYASAASLYEVGFNHFFRGPDDASAGDQIYFQGHAAPGIYARAFLEGRLSEEQLDHFRREALWPGGLSSYPHPRLMPDFWQFPTVSMGLGPINAIYQARFNRYLAARGIVDTSASRVWGFLGDGEMDEPEALGALGLAAREGLDNLIFVVNCNLQRLDGPVRGNGKIIQELEATFRGAGWHVIKVIWSREWDDLLARDKDGVLLAKMNETLDGDYQRLSVADGAFIREHFFGPDPRLKALVEHLPDEDLPKLRRGGHDYRKVYAAYAAAVEHTGSPVVILAKTVKGWTLGPGIEARNVTHQAKKLTQDELKIFRDRLELPIPDDQLADAPYYHPGTESPEIQYMLERRNQLGGAMPRRVVRPMPLPDAADEAYAELFAGSERAASTTMAFSRLTRNLTRDPTIGQRIVPIIPDEARTFGMDPLFKEVGIYNPLGQRYTPVDKELLLSYLEKEDGQILEEGITEAGAMADFTAAGTSLRRARPADDPLLHLLLDVRLPAHRRPGLGLRRRPRPRLPDGRHRRPHHADRRGAAARRRAQPHPGVGPAQHPRLRPGLRLRAGGHRARRHPAHVRRGAGGRLLLRHPLQRELGDAAQARWRGRGHRARPVPVPPGRQGLTPRAAAGVGLDPAPGHQGAAAAGGALRHRRRPVERPVLPAAAQRGAGDRALEPAASRGRGAGAVRRPAAGPDRRTDRGRHRLPQGGAAHGGAAGSTGPSPRWAPMASAAATRARRCASTSR